MKYFQSIPAAEGKSAGNGESGEANGARPDSVAAVSC
jgi:hypothetical protein